MQRSKPQFKTQNLDMREIILDFPKQFKIGFDAAKNIKIKKKFDGIVICGMGGSALAGEILRMYLHFNKISLPVILHKNYGLPFNIDKPCVFYGQKKQGKNYLIICISYSGNTEETLSAYQEAKTRGFSVVCIASGGQLAEFCKKHKIPAAIIPSGIPPRLSIGYQFSALMKILSNCNIIKAISILDTVNLNPDTVNLNLQSPGLCKLEEQGKRLAKKLFLFQKIPFIYAPENLKALAYIWKINFNETTKIIAEYGVFPELSHNEINGFWKINEAQLPGKKIFVVFLKSSFIHPRILKQMEIIEDLIKKQGIKIQVISISINNVKVNRSLISAKTSAKDFFEEIFSNIILAFWTSYYLALEYKVDPIETRLIDEFKERMKKRV